MKNIMSAIKGDWYAFYILGLSIITAFAKWLILKKKKEPKEDASCLGCKHLGYWNDGSALCAKDLQDACIHNGFKYREVSNYKQSSTN